MENVVTLSAVELLKQEQANALAMAEALEQQIIDAEAQERAEQLHKVINIVENLENQYGEDFVTIVKTKYATKQVILLTDAEQIDDYNRFATLVERGYKLVNGEIVGKRGDVINSPTINSQIKDEAKVLMNRPKFIKMWLKFK
jgi:hypothetical protein